MITKVEPQEITDLNCTHKKWAMPGEYELVETTILPKALDVEVGQLKIVHTGDPENFFAGIGAKIYLDGKEMEGVRSLTLRISVDEAVNMTVQQFIKGPKDD